MDVRLSESEHARLMAAAEREHLTTGSAMARRLVLLELERMEAETVGRVPRSAI